MKESLKLLGVDSSGLDEQLLSFSAAKNDDEIFREASAMLNLQEKETFLREQIKKTSSSCLKSKNYLAELIREKDPQYACELVKSTCKAQPVNPANYYCFAEIAVCHGAWEIARSILEIVIWLATEKDTELLNKANVLLKQVQEKIISGVKDNSMGDFWRSKVLEKYRILERLYYQSEFSEMVNYSFKLLEKFPENLNNYYDVFKALSLLDDRSVLNRFVEHINNTLKEDVKNKNFYLGLAYHTLFEFDKSCDCLKEFLKTDLFNSQALFYLALNCLIQNKLKEFVLASQRILPSSEPEFAALFFIYSVIVNAGVYGSEYPNQKNISKELSKILEKVIKCGQVDNAKSIINLLKKSNCFSVLPYLPFHLSELFIRNNELDFAYELLEECTDPEVFRLKSWIYRLRGKDVEAENELVNYRKANTEKKETGIDCQLLDFNFPKSLSGDEKETFELLEDMYKQTEKFIKEIDLEYGLNGMTCVETKCQDCCTKTFPLISYTEYLYLRKWIDEQPVDFRNQIQDSSKEIVKSYKERYKKEPPFLFGTDFDLHKDYPMDFTFKCPNLGDNKCNVYEVRPFTCRTYSYATQDGVRYIGCKYFYEQFKNATKLTNVRKVINMNSFFKFTKLTDENLIGKRIVAPIPIWFAQNHEETLEKLRVQGLSKE